MNRLVHFGQPMLFCRIRSMISGARNFPPDFLSAGGIFPVRRPISDSEVLARSLTRTIRFPRNALIASGFDSSMDLALLRMIWVMVFPD